jgi:hypothetical protein
VTERSSEVRKSERRSGTHFFLALVEPTSALTLCHLAFRNLLQQKRGCLLQTACIVCCRTRVRPGDCQHKRQGAATAA